MNPRHALVNGIEQSPMPVICMHHLANAAQRVQDRRGRPLDMLEVGSLFGESTAQMAPYGHVTCVDLFTQDFDRFLTQTQGFDLMIRQGNSVDILPTLPGQVFDLIFLDGDHRWPTVDSDITQARRLIRPGGIICGDDLERVLESEDEYLAVIAYRGEDYHEGFHPGVSCAVYEQFGTDVTMRDRFWWVNCP